MAWGAIPAVSKLGIFGPIAGFIGGLFSKFVSWLVLVKLSGALYRVTMAITFLTMTYGIAFVFVVEVNQRILQVYNDGGMLTRALVDGIAAFLPSYTPIAVSIILWYYVTSLTVHIGVEIIKWKQRLAEKATERFIA